MMNKLPFANANGTYYTPQGLVRERKREKRSRSKTVTDRGYPISKTISRSSDDERTSSPSPELVHTVPVTAIAVENLPSLPDSIPSTPATKTFESATPDTPKATASAGSVSQYLQPFVEDESEQATPRNEIPEPLVALVDTEIAKVPDAATEPIPVPDVESATTAPTPETSQTVPAANEEVVPENTLETAEEPPMEQTTALPQPSQVATPPTPPPEEPKPSETPTPAMGEQPRTMMPPPSTTTDTSLVHSQYHHPAHGIAQGYPYHPSQFAYQGYPLPRDSQHTPVQFPHSPAFGPLVSYSPVPGFHPYGPVHPLSLVPASQAHGQYQQHPGMDMGSPTGPSQRFERGALPAPNAAPQRQSSDETIIQQLAEMLPDIVRLVANQGHQKAEMRAKADVKAVQVHYSKIIEELTAERTALRRDVTRLKQKADQADAFLLDNARLLSEKQAVVQDLSALREERMSMLQSHDAMVKERALILQSHDALGMTHREHEKAIADLRHMLEGEKRAHENTAKSAQSETSKQNKILDEVTARLRSEIISLTTDRNTRAREAEAVQGEQVSRISQLEAKVKDLENELDKSRRPRRDETPSRHSEKAQVTSSGASRETSSRSTMPPPASVTPAASRMTTAPPQANSTSTSSRESSSRSTSAASYYDRDSSVPAATRRTNPSQAPASHRNSIATQYFQSSNSSRPGVSDRLPGGYDYYDEVREPPKMERTSSSRSAGAEESLRGDSRRKDDR